jgi:hypothetical protein
MKAWVLLALLGGLVGCSSPDPGNATMPSSGNAGTGGVGGAGGVGGGSGLEPWAARAA